MFRTTAIGISMMILWASAVQAERADLRGGLVVCIGADALESVAEKWKMPGYVFHCLETSDEKVAKTRSRIKSAGCYGKVSVAKFSGGRLPYINNLVNAIVIKNTKADLQPSEIQRVMAPYGVAIAAAGTSYLPKASRNENGLVQYVKPYPDNLDEWPQYLHGADNNCVAKDTVVGPPRHVQWVSNPAWTRSHMGVPSITSMISAGGRLFTIEDRETAENPYLPSRWQLIVRDAFNGVVLWTMEIPDWETVMVYIKDYHAQMKRRLVAIGDEVFCTPGISAPLTVLDAATGRQLQQFKGTEGTQEFAYHEGRLYLVIGDRMNFDGYQTSEGKKRGKNAKNDPPVGDPSKRV